MGEGEFWELTQNSTLYNNIHKKWRKKWYVAQNKTEGSSNGIVYNDEIKPKVLLCITTWMNGTNIEQ